MKANRRHAFTLVELLVVLGIIAILVSLTAGAVIYSQTLSRLTECQAQLRDIGHAIEQAKMKRVRLTSSSFDEDDPTWAQKLIPYVDEEIDVFRCPSDADQIDLDAAEAPSFGISNRFHVMTSEGDGDRIVMIDYMKPIVDVVGADPEDISPNADPDASEGWDEFIPIERHGGETNALFYGGQVTQFVFEDIDPLNCDLYERLWRPMADESIVRSDCLTDDGDDDGT